MLVARNKSLYIHIHICVSEVYIIMLHNYYVAMPQCQLVSISVLDDEVSDESVSHCDSVKTRFRKPAL